MYRDYENPYTLQVELEEEKRRLEEAERAGWDEEDLIDIQISIAELEERINFAWSDDEFEVEGY